MRSASQGSTPLLVHYFFCLFSKYVKTLLDQLKQAVFDLITESMDGLFHKKQNGASNMEP